MGVVEKASLIDGKTIVAGDVLLGLASSGFHSNGYSLVRRAFLDELRLDLAATPAGLDEPLGQALLRPTRIYVRALRALAAAGLMRGAAHITGGGLVDNPTAHVAPGALLALQINLAVPGRRRRSSASCRSWATWRPRRCGARSTWASAWWWCPGRRGRRGPVDAGSRGREGHHHRPGGGGRCPDAPVEFIP